MYASVLTHYEGLIGHPLDPIGCLFDILMSAVTRQPAESEAQSLTSLMGASHGHTAPPHLCQSLLSPVILNYNSIKLLQCCAILA